MFKGKYVLLPYEELKEKISKYLEIDFELYKSSDLLLNINKNSIKGDLDSTLSEIVGENKNLIDDIDTTKDDILLNITECSYMLQKIFYIEERVIFDSEALFVNNAEDIYLFYV